MEGYRLCTSTHSSALKWSVKDPLPFLPVVTNAPWQIIDKKKKKEVETVTAVEVQNLQTFSLGLLQLMAVCQEKAKI